MYFWAFFKANFEENKYAIYAYTHGPVTGSGPGLYKPWLLLASIGHGAKGPSLLPPSSLIQPMWISRPPIGVGREKNKPD